MSDVSTLQMNRKLQTSEMEALRENLRPAMGIAVDPDVIEFVMVMVGNQQTVSYIEQQMQDLEFTPEIWEAMKKVIVEFLQSKLEETKKKQATTVKRLDDTKEESNALALSGALSAGRERSSGSRQKRAFERLTKESDPRGDNNNNNKQQRGSPNRGGRGPPNNRREEEFIRAPSGDRRRDSRDGRGGRDGPRHSRDGPPGRDSRGGGRGGRDHGARGGRDHGGRGGRDHGSRGGRDHGGRGGRDHGGGRRDFEGRGGRDHGRHQGLPPGRDHGGRFRDDRRGEARGDNRRQDMDRFEGTRPPLPGRDGGGRGGWDGGRGRNTSRGRGDSRGREGGRGRDGGRGHESGHGGGYEESWDEPQNYKRPRYEEGWVPRGGRHSGRAFRGHPSPLVAARGRGRGRHFPDYNEVKSKMASMQWVAGDASAKADGEGGEGKTD